MNVYFKYCTKFSMKSTIHLLFVVPVLIKENDKPSVVIAGISPKFFPNQLFHIGTVEPLGAQE